MLLLLQTVHHNAYHADPYAQEFGIKIDERLASVEARVLPAPWVCNATSFGQGTSFLACSMHVLYKGCRIEMPLEKTMLRRKSWSNEEYIIVIICIRCDYGISVLCSACLFGVQISIACQINWL